MAGRPNLSGILLELRICKEAGIARQAAPHREMPVMQCTSTLASFSLLTLSAAAHHSCEPPSLLLLPTTLGSGHVSQEPGWWRRCAPRKSKHSWKAGGDVLTVW